MKPVTITVNIGSEEDWDSVTKTITSCLRVINRANLTLNGRAVVTQTLAKLAAEFEAQFEEDLLKKTTGYQMTKHAKPTPPNANAKKRAIIHIGKYEKEALKHWTPEMIKALADDMLDWFRADEGRLWLQDYFNERLISRNSITRILARDKYFAEIYAICKSIQESRLFHAGFHADGNVNQIIFALKNVSKWRNEPKEEPEEPQRAVVVLRPTRLAASDDDDDDDIIHNGNNAND